MSSKPNEINVDVSPCDDEPLSLNMSHLSSHLSSHGKIITYVNYVIFKKMEMMHMHTHCQIHVHA